MEKNGRETGADAEAQNVLKEDEAVTRSPLDEHEGAQDESEPGRMERTKEVLENIGAMINSI